jgi:predicted Na+-dependent transporter
MRDKIAAIICPTTARAIIFVQNTKDFVSFSVSLVELSNIRMYRPAYTFI